MSRRLCADTVGIGGWWMVDGAAIPQGSRSRARRCWSRALLYCRTMRTQRALSSKLAFCICCTLVMRGSCVLAVRVCVCGRATPLPRYLSRVFCSGDQVQFVNCVTVPFSVLVNATMEGKTGLVGSEVSW